MCSAQGVDFHLPLAFPPPSPLPVCVSLSFVSGLVARAGCQAEELEWTEGEEWRGEERRGGESWSGAVRKTRPEAPSLLTGNKQLPSSRIFSPTWRSEASQGKRGIRARISLGFGLDFTQVPLEFHPSSTLPGRLRQFPGEVVTVDALTNLMNPSARAFLFSRFALFLDVADTIIIDGREPIITPPTPPNVANADAFA